MIVFIPADDALREKIIESLNHSTVQINGVKHIFGPVSNYGQFMVNELNENSKLLVIEHSEGFIPLVGEDCIALTKEKIIKKIVDFDEIMTDIGIFSMLV